MKREIPQATWTEIFRSLDATIERLVVAGVDRERAYDRIAAYTRARQSEAAIAAINAEGK